MTDTHLYSRNKLDGCSLEIPRRPKDLKFSPVLEADEVKNIWWKRVYIDSLIFMASLLAFACSAHANQEIPQKNKNKYFAYDQMLGWVIIIIHNIFIRTVTTLHIPHHFFSLVEAYILIGWGLHVHPFVQNHYDRNRHMMNHFYQGNETQRVKELTSILIRLVILVSGHRTRVVGLKTNLFYCIWLVAWCLWRFRGKN